MREALDLLEDDPERKPGQNGGIWAVAAAVEDGLDVRHQVHLLVRHEVDPGQHHVR